MKKAQIIVGRDRAHVRALLGSFPDCEVISASAFFDKVRTLAFLADPKLQLDDNAPLIFAQQVLASSADFPCFYALNFAQAFSALFHGTIGPVQVCAQVAPLNLSFGPALKITSQIQELMERQNLVNRVSALHRAWRILEEKQVVPPALVNNPTISLRYLIDLTALEVEVIKSLSILGIHFDICFPLDFAKRKLNVAVDFAARQFENSAELLNIDLSFDKLSSPGPLAALVDALLVDGQTVEIGQEHCELYEAYSLDEEANEVASRIAYEKSKHPCTVALVMRSYDQRAELFKRALIAHNISVKDRKGQPLLETPAGILLQIILSARLHVLPKSDLLGLINHPLFLKQAPDDALPTGISELLVRLGIDDRFLALSLPLTRYELALGRYQKSLSPDDPTLTNLQALRNLLEHMQNILSLLKACDSFAGYLGSLRQIIESSFQPDNNSVQALLDIISALAKSPAHKYSTQEIKLHDFIALLKAPLGGLTVARPDHSNQDAVEFLLLPELLGRSFDHVFIADISFGHMPKNPSVDPLFNDEQRLMLNKALGCQALRVYLDDPFEPLPVPPRQALEPFWFASAIACAIKSVHMSYARHNQSGVEQAPSEFFTWLKNHVIIKQQEGFRPQKFISPEYARFLDGQQERLIGDHSLNPQAVALRQRKMAFKSEGAHVFAFGFDDLQMLERFAGRLGPKPWRALTPTMVEAFAQCRFQGLLTRILGLDPIDASADDLDARVLGQIAHQTLEQFFAQASPKAELKTLLKKVGQDYETNNYLASPDIFWCYIDWLYEALLKLVDQLSATKAEPLAQEQAFGLSTKALAALPILTKGQSYLLGGVIDRVDRVGKNIEVMDYKLSSADTLRATGSARAVLNTNFQVPIYLRLAAHAWAEDDPARVSFAFASIRDGLVLPQLTKAKHADLFQRIFEDDHPESLAEALHKIFAPLSQGKAVASKGEHCTMCQFSYVCRVAEGSRA